MHKEEEEAVKIEVQKLKAEVQSLRTKVAQQGADVRAWFRLEGSKNTRRRKSRNKAETRER